MSRKIGLTLIALAAGMLCASTASANQNIEKIEYSYDARGRLVKVKRDATVGTVNANVQACYKYDRADNRTNVTTTTTSPVLPCPPPP